MVEVSGLQVALGLLFIPVIAGLVTVILQKAGAYVALYLWAFMLILALFLMTIYPVAIAPLFNRFSPLPEGSLR